MDAKEELSKVAVSALKDLLANLEQAKAFTLEQAPEVLRQMVLVARIESGLELSVALIVLGVYAYGWRVVSKLDFDTEQKFVLRGLGAVVTVLPVTLWAENNLHNTITCWFAPKLFLVETIGSLLK